MTPSNSPLCCPACRGPVVEHRRELSAQERAAFFFADLPFWILFGACVAIGMWQWLAGAVGFAVTLFIFYRWHQGRTRFRCFACDKSFSHPELQSNEAHQ